MARVQQDRIGHGVQSAGEKSTPKSGGHWRSLYPATTLADADLAELVRLYGLRNWIEQSYRQVRQSLGWSHYQVRSDLAIRRHWALVCCAFSFCWASAEVDAPADAPPPDD